jgi:outer membrane translocation and assembly module TamA
MLVVLAIFFFSIQSADAQTQLGVTTKAVSPSVQNGPTNRKVIVESLVISDTRSIEAAQLDEIVNSVSGSVLDEDKENLEARILSQFHDRGYCTATVDNLEVKVLDPLASPRPARLEADVTEGPLCRLSQIEFSNNHAFSSTMLRAKFPAKSGDVFKRATIVGGFQALHKLYSSRGYLNSSFTPNLFVDSLVNLTIEVREGPQYRMGSLEIFGSPELAARLQTRWKLHPGSVFNPEYLGTFTDKNRLLLPPDFTVTDNVALITDCPAATVSVHLHLSSDPQHEALDRTKGVNCAKKDENQEEPAGRQSPQ